jgi:chromosome segregation ATPase
MKSLFTAARHPLFLTVAVVAVISGLLVAPWLLPLGIMIYIVSVLLAARDPALAARIERNQRSQGLTSPTFVARVNSIEQSRKAVLRALQQTGGPVAQRLRPTIEPQTAELVEQAYTLARKGQDIERYLSQVNHRSLQEQMKEIDRRIAQTSDQYTINQLQGTLQALKHQVESAQVLDTYIGRIKSQLENIDANLDAMPAQFIRLQASDTDASMASSQIASSLQDMNADMHSFVDMLDNALDQTRTVAP